MLLNFIQLWRLCRRSTGVHRVYQWFFSFQTWEAISNIWCLNCADTMGKIHCARTTFLTIVLSRWKTLHHSLSTLRLMFPDTLTFNFRFPQLLNQLILMRVLTSTNQLNCPRDPLLDQDYSAIHAQISHLAGLWCRQHHGNPLSHCLLVRDIHRACEQPHIAHMLIDDQNLGGKEVWPTSPYVSIVSTRLTFLICRCSWKLRC